ncbi:ATP-binding cassette domain-containing protein [Desulfococcaceae bacterium HSG8]|nr:ATP-binding cassette domain-containing protein [Desulfococcaceae bacterium HSG8]
MISDQSPRKRRFFAPEVVQTSAMDCGPATLKCILEGFGIPVSYGRLREACQTDVDGTSIDVMEDVAVQLGLDAEQIIVPPDHLLLPGTRYLPAITIVRLPNGFTHFVVLWSLHGPVIQVMDPATGRIWRTHRQFLSEVYNHIHPIPSDDWREWACSEAFCDPLCQRMERIGLEEADIEEFVDTASSDPGWHSIAALDASVRMTDSIIRARGLDRGEEARKVLKSFYEDACEDVPGKMEIIPRPYWSVLPSEDEEEMLLFKGAVIVRVLGHLQDARTEEAEESDAPRLSPELAAALEEKPARPGFEILRFLSEDGLFIPSVLLSGLGISVFCVIIEAILFRGLLDIGYSLNLTAGERTGAIAMLFLFAVGMIFLEVPVAAVSRRMGRRLEIRLRTAFLKKIPRLSDRYFHSRLTSDMTYRIHELRGLRTLPLLGVGLIRTCFQIILTGAGIAFLFPPGAMIAILAAAFAALMPFAVQSFMSEQDLRVRTHASGLSRFYLDTLLGLIPIRTHCAERAVRREHESLLVEWIMASRDFFKTTVCIGAIEALAGAGFAVWVVSNYISGGETSGLLLLLYWTLNLPVLGKNLAGFAQQYPMQRNRVLRLLEPLGAAEETEEDPGSGKEDESVTAETPEACEKGVAITLENVSVQAGGHTILSSIDLNIEAGEHIAIVGPSGAGKSSLVGLLLGWHRPASGEVRTDGVPLRGEKLRTLRRETAWVDPGIRLWNRSLFENLHYGSQNDDLSPLNAIVEADLFDVLEKLPEGFQTKLGEAGGLVSGGEGQRVRLGRAILRTGTRLAILDEPFRGLDREKRRELLARARNHWQDATLIFISHDVGETRTFHRILMIEDGCLVENDSPENLIKNPNSRYLALLESEEAVRKGLWESADWRRFWLENGNVIEKPRDQFRG